MKNFIRMYVLLLEIAQDVIRSFLENQYKPDTFQGFLKQYQHVIYHLCFNKWKCCVCTSSTYLPRQQIIRTRQFNDYFVQQGQGCGARNCSCNYSVKTNVQVEDIDITLCTTLLTNCYSNVLIPNEIASLTDIRDIRNEVAHHAQTEINDVDFNRMWLQVTNAALHLAGCITKDYEDEINERIERLKNRSVSPEEYNQILVQLLQRNNEIEDMFQTMMEMFERFVRPTDVAAVEKKECTTSSAQSTIEESDDFEEQVLHNFQQTTEDNVLEVGFRRLSSYQHFTEEQNYSEDTDLISMPCYHSLINKEDESDNETLDNQNLYLREELNGFQDECAGNETELNALGGYSHPTGSSLDETESNYFQIYNEIELMRKNGQKDIETALTYTLLIYIGLYGSTLKENISVEVLYRIFHTICPETPPENHDVMVTDCLNRLLTKYLENPAENFTPRDKSTSQAILHSFGEACPECFLQVCSYDILFENVFPKGVCIDTFHVAIDRSILAIGLVNRMQRDSDALHVGKYIRKIGIGHGYEQTVDHFLDELNQSEDFLKTDIIINLLDGITSKGKDFKFIETYSKIIHTLCCHVDKYENTIFHYIVAKSIEVEKFHLYIEYFCEHNICVMQIQNIDKHSPTDFAAYLGRSQIMGNILCNTSNDEENLEMILIMVKYGVDLLSLINHGCTDARLALKLELEEVKIGKKHEYERIIEIIDKRDVYSLVGDDIFTSYEEKTETKEKVVETNSNKETSSDAASVIGEAILDLIVDIKKGLSALTKIPDVIKTVHKCTHLKNQELKGSKE